MTMSDRREQPYVREPRLLSNEARHALERAAATSPAVRELLNHIAYREDQLWGIRTLIYEAYLQGSTTLAHPNGLRIHTDRLALVALEYAQELQECIDELTQKTPDNFIVYPIDKSKGNHE